MRRGEGRGQSWRDLATVTRPESEYVGHVELQLEQGEERLMNCIMTQSHSPPTPHASINSSPVFVAHFAILIFQLVTVF